MTMSDECSREEETAFVRKVAAKAARKLKAQRDGHKASGLVSACRDLSVGRWRCQRSLGALLGSVVGPAPSGSPFLDAACCWSPDLCIGCANAWHWVSSRTRPCRMNGG